MLEPMRNVCPHIPQSEMKRERRHGARTVGTTEKARKRHPQKIVISIGASKILERSVSTDRLVRCSCQNFLRQNCAFVQLWRVLDLEHITRTVSFCPLFFVQTDESRVASSFTSSDFGRFFLSKPYKALNSAYHIISGRVASRTRNGSADVLNVHAVEQRETTGAGVLLKPMQLVRVHEYLGVH